LERLHVHSYGRLRDIKTCMVLSRARATRARPGPPSERGRDESPVKLPTCARFSTVCLHAGQEPDPSTGAIITPIYQTSTYVQDELGKHKGYEYARTQNPTRMALERNVAAIEAGQAGFAFASGMAAIGAIATLLKSGDHVVVSDNTYGGTF